MPDTYSPTTERPGRLLMVDDDSSSRELISNLLAGHPFRVSVASSGSEALLRCDEVAFEGVLMDVNLPDIGGIEVCRHLRETCLNAETPVLFISAARMSEADRLEGLAAGGLDYLTWPYALPELLAKLRMVVAFTRQHRALVAAQRELALLEVTGGALHELSQPLTSAQLLLDIWRNREAPPRPEELEQLRGLIEKVNETLLQLGELKQYKAKPYFTDTILDLKESRKLGPGGSS